MENVRMKNVETQFLRLPVYKQVGVGTSQHQSIDIREHAVACPIFDLVTPNDDDVGSVSDVTKIGKV